MLLFLLNGFSLTPITSDYTPSSLRSTIGYSFFSSSSVSKLKNVSSNGNIKIPGVSKHLHRIFNRTNYELW